VFVHGCECVIAGVSVVGMRVFVHGCAATPLTLLDALAKHGLKSKLKDVELIHIHTEGPAVCVQPEYDGVVFYCALCCLSSLRFSCVSNVCFAVPSYGCVWAADCCVLACML